jgi:hypothetical protein
MSSFTDIVAVKGWHSSQPEDIGAMIAVRATPRALPLIIDVSSSSTP